MPQNKSKERINISHRKRNRHDIRDMFAKKKAKNSDLIEID